jgi:hypothetical protein
VVWHSSADLLALPSLPSTYRRLMVHIFKYCTVKS